MVKASIILPTYGSRLGYLEDAVASLQRQDFSLEYEIIVVNNGPGLGVRLIVENLNKKGMHRVIYVNEPEAGAAKARHTGVKAAKGEFFVFVDDDILVPVDWLQFLLKPFSNPKVGCTGGKIDLQFEKQPPDWWAKQFGRGYLSLLDHGNKTKVLAYPDFVWSCNMAVRKDVFYEVGGFNPDFSGDPSKLWFTGDNECGLEMKIYEAGHKIIYEPEARIDHRIPASRLTPKYFYDRNYIEGIMDSFTHVRQQKGKKRVVLLLVSYSVYCYGMSLKKLFGSFVKRAYAMKSKADSLRWYAKAEHHLRAAFSSKLREHIWQNSYI